MSNNYNEPGGLSYGVVFLILVGAVFLLGGVFYEACLEFGLIKVLTFLMGLSGVVALSSVVVIFLCSLLIYGWKETWHDLKALMGSFWTKVKNSFGKILYRHSDRSVKRSIDMANSVQAQKGDVNKQIEKLITEVDHKKEVNKVIHRFKIAELKKGKSDKANNENIQLNKFNELNKQLKSYFQRGSR